ncbi:MAG: lipocalin family protein [Bacteroidales bacterium]
MKNLVKKTVSKIILFSGALAILFLINCKKDDDISSNISSSIVGKWGITHVIQKIYNNEILLSSTDKAINATDSSYFLLDINANNTYIVSYPNSGTHPAENGTYTVSGNSFTIVQNGNTQKLSYSLNLNTLSIFGNDTSGTYRYEMNETFIRK